MRPGDREPLVDPSVLSWDAVARGETIAPPGCDAAEFALLRRFHQLDRVPMPSPGFFGDLEDHVHRFAPAAAPARPRSAAQTSRSESSLPRSAARPAAIDRALRLPSAWVAVAALLAIVLAGVLVVYAVSPSRSEPPAIPAAVIAKPTMEPLLQFEFDPPQWGMPEATTWTHLDFSVISLGPGKSFDTNRGWYTSTDGPLLLYLLDGELTVQPAGPSLLYRGDGSDRPPAENDAGQTISLEPGDGIVYSIHDAATASNPGTETMHALIGLAGSEDFTVPGASTRPTDVNRDLFEYDDGMPEPLTTGAQVSLQQLELQPYDAYVFEDVDKARMLALAPRTASMYWFHGAFDSAPPGAEGFRLIPTTVFRYLGNGAYTLVNIGSEPVVVYFFVLEPSG